MNDENPDVAAAAASPTDALARAEAVNDPVLVVVVSSHEESEVVCATLAAAGIPALVQSPTSRDGLPLYEMEPTVYGIFVSPSDLEAARALVFAPEPTEEDLAAEEEADPTTLEQAEARLKDAESGR